MCFEEAEVSAPQEVLAHTILHILKYMLPLRKVDITINNLAVEARVLDNGSQIVAIHEDLAHEVHAWINHDPRMARLVLFPVIGRDDGRPEVFPVALGGETCGDATPN